MIDSELSELQRVENWRYEQLVKAGLDPEDAAYVASRMDVDVRFVAALLQRNCPSRLALEIVL